MDEPPVTIINFFVYQNSVIERKHWAYLTPADDNATICMLPGFESSIRQAVKRVYFETSRSYMALRDEWYRIEKNEGSSKKDAALAKIDDRLEEIGLQVWVMWTGQSTLLMLLAQREMESRGERDFPESMMQLITEAYAATGPEGIEDIATWMTEFQRLYTEAKDSKARNAKVENAELKSAEAKSEPWRYFCKDIDQQTEIWGNWRLQLNNIYFANRLMLPLDDTILQTKKRIERLESELFSKYRGGNLTSPEGRLLVSSVSNAQVDLMDLTFRRRLLQRRTATEFPGNGFPILNETSLTRYLEEDIENRKQSPDPNSERLQKNWLKSLIRLKDYNNICRGYLWHTLSFTSVMATDSFVICQYFQQHLLSATTAPPWIDSTLVENTRRFLRCLKRYVREAEVANREIKTPSFVYQRPPSMADDMAPTPADHEEVPKMSDCRPEADVEAENPDEIQRVGMTTGEYFLAEAGPSVRQELIQTAPATPDLIPNVTPSSEQDSPQLACKSFFQNPVAAVVSFATDFMVSAGMGLCRLETGSEVAEAEPSTETSISGQLAKHPESETGGRIDENLKSPFTQNTSRCSRGEKKELMGQEKLTCLTTIGTPGGEQRQRSKHLTPDIDGLGGQHQAISKNLAPSKESLHTVNTKQLHPQRNHRKKAKAVKRQPFQFALKSKDEPASSPPQKGSTAKQTPAPFGIDTSEKRPETQKPPAKQSGRLLLDGPMPHNKSGAAEVDKAPQAVTKDKRAPAPKKTKRRKTSSLSKSIPPTNAAIIEKPNSGDEIAIKKGQNYPIRAHKNRSKAVKEPNGRPTTVLPPVVLPKAKQEAIEVVCREIKPRNALNPERTMSTAVSTKGSTPPRDSHTVLGGVGTQVDGQTVQKMELLPVSNSESAIDNLKNGPPKKEQAPVHRQRPTSPADLEAIGGKSPRVVARHLVDTEKKEKSLEKSIIEEVWQPVSQETKPGDFHDLRNFPALTGCGLGTADKRQAQSSESWKQWTRSAAINPKLEDVNVKITQDLTAVVNAGEEGNSRNESQPIPTYHKQGKESDPSPDTQDHGGRKIQGAEIATSQETEPEFEAIKPGQEVESESRDYASQDGSMFEEDYQKVKRVSEILKDSSSQSHSHGLEPLPAPKRSGQLQAGFTEDTNITDTLSIRSKPANIRKWDVPDPPEISKPRQGPLLSLPLQQYSWPPQAVRYLELLSPKISTKSHARKQYYTPIMQPLVAEVPKDWEASKLPESPSTISIARKLQELSPGVENGAHGILPVGCGRNQRSWHEQPADISKSAYLGPINDQIPPIDPFWKQLLSRPSHYPWFIHRSKVEASQVERNALAGQKSDRSSNCGNISSSEFSLESGNQSQHGSEPIPEAKAVLLKETKAFESAISRWSKQVGTSHIIERYRPEVLPPSRPPSVTDEIMPQTEDYSRDNLLVGPYMLAGNWSIENTTGSMPIAISPPLSGINHSYNRKTGGLADPVTPNPLYPTDDMSTIDDNTS